MTSDLRSLVARDIRRHPRVAYQGLIADRDAARAIAEALPPLTPRSGEYHGAIAVVDWDHRLPSSVLVLRIHGYYSPASLEAGEEAYDDRLELIGARDRFPEFDVPDFANLVADEAYEAELALDASVGRCQLTSAWRRSVPADDARRAEDIVKASRAFRELDTGPGPRPPQLGGLEVVAWTPPCESDHPTWTVDVWYLLSFDGRIGTGMSFLVDLAGGHVASAREFQVRAG